MSYKSPTEFEYLKEVYTEMPCHHKAVMCLLEEHQKLYNEFVEPKPIIDSTIDKWKEFSKTKTFINKEDEIYAFCYWLFTYSGTVKC